MDIFIECRVGALQIKYLLHLSGVLRVQRSSFYLRFSLQQLKLYLAFVQLRTSHKLPGAAGAAGDEHTWSGKVLQGGAEGAVGRAALSADNCGPRSRRNRGMEPGNQDLSRHSLVPSMAS